MAAVTNQPLPFGRLEREKHIHVIFRAFNNRCGPSCERQTQIPLSKSHQTPPGLESEAQLSGRTAEKEKRESVKLNRPEKEKQETHAGMRSHFMSVLETASEIHITAKPALQGEWGSFFSFVENEILAQMCVY